MLGKAMRSGREQDVSALIRHYAHTVGDGTANESTTSKFWRSAGKQGIKRELLRKYQEALAPGEETKSFDLREAIDVMVLVQRLPPHDLHTPQGTPLHHRPSAFAVILIV
jgi:hypothetical protein